MGLFVIAASGTYPDQYNLEEVGPEQALKR